MATRGKDLFSLYIYIENFKNLLVRNQWTDLTITWQECFFGDPLPRLFKPLWFVKKCGWKGAGLIFPIYVYRKLGKSPVVRNHWTDFSITAEMFPWWSFTKIVQVVMICQKTWLLGGGGGGLGLFSLYIYIENLKKSSYQKPLDRFQYNLADMFPWWPFTKIVQAVMICQKIWLLGVGLISLIYLYRKL